MRAGVRTVDVVASHVLVRGLVARDLDELNSAQHRDPDQLKNDPDVDDQGEGVSSHIVAQSIVDNAALGIRRRQVIDV